LPTATALGVRGKERVDSRADQLVVEHDVARPQERVRAEREQAGSPGTGADEVDVAAPCRHARALCKRRASGYDAFPGPGGRRTGHRRGAIALESDRIGRHMTGARRDCHEPRGARPGTYTLGS
jgi:hypothetical protein